MVGSLDYAPNVDAVQFFMQDVFPLIRRELPQCRLTVVGKNPPPSIRRAHGAGGVEVWPDVSDVRPYYEKAMLAPVALRSGGGSRLKILEALAQGTPVISTGIGFEGLSVQPDRDILKAETPADFVRLSVEVMRNPKLWNELSVRGRALVEACYDWKHICAGLREAYQTCLALPAQRKEKT
jgi:glycosyltransferase involved in cell wall biosynthesis